MGGVSAAFRLRPEVARCADEAFGVVVAVEESVWAAVVSASSLAAEARVTLWDMSK